MKKILLILAFSGFVFINVNAQGAYDDFIYQKTAIKERKVVPWPFLREADVHYAQFIYRNIDVREKMNTPMKWPKNPLSHVIYDAVTGGKGAYKPTLTAYMYDSLVTFFTPEEVLKLGGRQITMQVPVDPLDPYNLKDTVLNEEFNPDKIFKFQLFEEWIFDRNTSEMYVRIIAIAPMYRPIAGNSGVELPETPMFWIKYAEARDFLVNQEVFNMHNDAARISYDDWFEQRLFTSYIIKKSNTFDYRIRDFDEFNADPYAALLEGEAVKTELFELEHDLWEY